MTRFDALSQTIGHWIRNVRSGNCDLDEAWVAVIEYNCRDDQAAVGREPGCGMISNALLERDQKNHGPMPREGARRPESG